MHFDTESVVYLEWVTNMILRKALWHKAKRTLVIVKRFMRH